MSCGVRTISGVPRSRLVASALELASITSEDPNAGLPDTTELGALSGDLQLCCAEVEGLVAEYGDVALSHFAQQVASLDPARRRALQRLARKS